MKMKRIASLLASFALTLAIGCTTAGMKVDKISKVVNLGDGKLAGVDIPKPIYDAGLAAGRLYLAQAAPWALPYVNQIFTQPDTSTTYSIKVAWSNQVTIELTNGTFLSGAEVKNFIVQPVAYWLLPELPTKALVVVQPGTVSSVPVATEEGKTNANYTTLDSALEALGNIK